MPTHCVSYYENPDGVELVAVEYQCSYPCMVDTLAKDAPYAVPASHAGTANGPNGDSVSWGACPGGAETNSAVYCSGCGEKLWDGLEDAVPERSYEGWTLADEGTLDGVQYVTVLDDGGNPYEYEVTAEHAQREYDLTLNDNPYPTT